MDAQPPGAGIEIKMPRKLYVEAKPPVTVECEGQIVTIVGKVAYCISGDHYFHQGGFNLPLELVDELKALEAKADELIGRVSNLF